MPLRERAWAPDACYRADGGISSHFLVLAASAAGVSHRLASRRCEDCYAWRVDSGNRRRLAIVIADGVGSAGRGGEGAETAVETASNYLASLDGDGGGGGNARARMDVPLGAWREWATGECKAAVRAANQALLAAGGSRAGELSTTLVAGLVEVGPDGVARMALARVGDSTAWVLSAAPSGSERGSLGGWRELFGALLDEQLRGVPTPALPWSGPGGGIEAVSGELASGSAVVLVTDGVGDPLRDGPSTVAPALGAVLEGGPRGELSPLALASAADFSRRGCQDDRTILVAWPL
ncbi:MAG TPA: protein phosphatase 2C domain-containing protein [Acidimicrobiales bacterium]|nr:protein phosphatase 2C domain-containing protein [Acidimicrobiales bacterium]